MALNILALSLEYLLRFVFLLLALWGMIKILRLRHKFLGLVVSAMLATALDMIPYVGHFIAVPVLAFCLKHVTNEDFTDVAFAIGVSYAVVFGINLFLLGLILGDLRPSARARKQADAAATANGESSSTNAAAAKSQKTPPGGTKPGKAKNTPPDPMVEVVSTFTLKGVSTGSENATAIVNTGVRSYTIGLGETYLVETTNGRVNIKLKAVSEGSALLVVADESVVLRR